jgi:hypothetical protein
MRRSGAEAIVSDYIVNDYFERLKRALAPLPRSRRNQLLEDLREHVTLARAGLSEESVPSVWEILQHLGAPEDIAAEALATAQWPVSRPSPGQWRPSPGQWRPSHGQWPLALGPVTWRPVSWRPVTWRPVTWRPVTWRPVTWRRALAMAAAVAVVAAGGTLAGILAGRGALPASVRTDAATVPALRPDCSPVTDAATSGGPAAWLTRWAAAEVASGTVAGHNWSLWSAAGQSGADGLEDGVLVIDGRAYGLCPGSLNPAELELADVGPAGVVYGIIGYPGPARVELYESAPGTFDRGIRLPAPSVTVVRGVSFFIGALPRSACDYPALELNSTSPGVSAESNLSFGACTAGRLVPITVSQGNWQLPPGQFTVGSGESQ